jgi:lipopolysaccharide export LptBFGC system permease protein LptF
MNTNIKARTLIIDNYNGKYSLIYNNNINNYQFIYDGNFTKRCDEYNQESEVNFSTTSKILDNKESTYIFISDNIKTEDSIKIYKTEETIITEIENSQILNENNLSDSSVIFGELTQKINETDLFFEDQNSEFLKKITQTK